MNAFDCLLTVPSGDINSYCISTILQTKYSPEVNDDPGLAIRHLEEFYEKFKIAPRSCFSQKFHIQKGIQELKFSDKQKVDINKLCLKILLISDRCLKVNELVDSIPHILLNEERLRQLSKNSNKKLSLLFMLGELVEREKRTPEFMGLLANLIRDITSNWFAMNQPLLEMVEDCPLPHRHGMLTDLAAFSEHLSEAPYSKEYMEATISEIKECQAHPEKKKLLTLALSFKPVSAKSISLLLNTFRNMPAHRLDEMSALILPFAGSFQSSIQMVAAIKMLLALKPEELCKEGINTVISVCKHIKKHTYEYIGENLEDRPLGKILGYYVKLTDFIPDSGDRLKLPLTEEPDFDSAHEFLGKLFDLADKNELTISSVICNAIRSLPAKLRPGVFTKLLKVPKVDRKDVIQKFLTFFRPDISWLDAKLIISVLGGLQSENRCSGFSTIKNLVRCFKAKFLYPILEAFYCFSAEEREAIFPLLLPVKEKLNGSQFYNLLRILHELTPTERLSHFNHVVALIKGVKSCWHICGEIERIKPDKRASAIYDVQSFLNLSKSSSTRSLLLRICTKPQWRESLLQLKENLERNPQAVSLLLILIFLPLEKQSKVYDLFTDPKLERLSCLEVLALFSELPLKNRKPHLMSLWCNANDSFIQDSGFGLSYFNHLLWILSPEQYPAFAEFEKGLLMRYRPRPFGESWRTIFLDFLTSPLTPTIPDNLSKALEKYTHPEDQRKLGKLIIENYNAFKLTYEHSLVAKVVQSRVHSKNVCNPHSIYSKHSEAYHSEESIQVPLSKIEINKKQVTWNLTGLQTTKSPFYTFADLEKKVSTEAVYQCCRNYLDEKEKYLGFLGIDSLIPSVMTLEGSPNESIPTTRFHLHYLFGDVLETPKQNQEEKLEKLRYWYNNNHSLSWQAEFFANAYYLLPVDQRCGNGIQKDKKFILECFKTTIQKVLHDGFYHPNFRRDVRFAMFSNFDSLIFLKNSLAKYVGYCHRIIYCENSPAILSEEDKRELLEKFFSFKTPRDAILQIISDSETLCQPKYKSSLLELLDANHENWASLKDKYFNQDGSALNEEGALEVLRIMGIVSIG